MKSQTVSMDDLGRLSQGITPNRYELPGGPPMRLLQVMNLEGLIVQARPEDRRESLDAQRVESALAREGQVLIALRTSSVRAAVVPATLTDAVVSNSLTILDVDTEIADPLFVAGLLSSEAMRRRFEPMSSGTAVQGISLAKFRTLKVELPSLERQRAFARVFLMLAEYGEATSALRTLRAEELEIHLRPLALQESP